jgi:hypothetical protein
MNAPAEGYDVFISYSSEDQALVDPVAAMLQLGGRRVFWDRHGIAAGSEWKPTLEDAIKSSAMMVVLWCCGSAKSNWVAREIRLARRHGIPIVAVRLCSYEVPPRIRKYQWVDLRGIVIHTCDHVASSRPETPDAQLGARGLVQRQAERVRAQLTLRVLSSTGGTIVAVLAQLRPFSSSLTPNQANQVNGLFLLIGAALVALSLVDLRTLWSQRVILIGKTRETLEMILDVLLKGGGSLAPTSA